MKITIDNIMNLKPCRDYPRERVEKLWCKSELTLGEVCDLEIPVQDRIWAIVRLISKDAAVRFAVDCAERVLPIFESRFPDDTRPREAVAAARTGCSTRAAGYAARAAGYAAFDAARSCSCAADTDADAASKAAAAAACASDAYYASDTSSIPDDYAARYACASANYAAYSAAYSDCAATDPAHSVRAAAEREWQINRLREICSEIETENGEEK